MNYLNFGEFYDRAAMAENEAEILQVQRENAAQYPLVTACLASADALLECVRLENRRYAEETDAIAQCLALSSLKPYAQTGKLARRFLSAVTPKGLRLCTDTPAALCPRVYALRDNYLLAPPMLQTLLDRAMELGHHCIVCHSPLLPQGQPTHLLIPTAGAAFVSETRDFPYHGECFCRIDLDATIPPEKRRELEFCGKTVSSLLYQTVGHLREAKRLHDQMEALCRPYVDFTAADALTEATISALFGEK